MKNLSTLFGDGDGNYSMMRVIMFLMVVAFIAAKFFNAWLTRQPITFTAQDLTLVGTLVGGKLLQNAQENSSAPKHLTPALSPSDAEREKVSQPSNPSNNP